MQVSDQSISHEEDFVRNRPKDPDQCGKNEQLKGFSLKDGFEMPVSVNGKSESIQSLKKLFASNSCEESISDEEENAPSNSSFASKYMDPQKDRGNQVGTSTWSAVHSETKELIHMQEKSGCLSSHCSNSEAKRALKGSRKAKPKFSIHFQTCHEGQPPIHRMTWDEEETSSNARPAPNKNNPELKIEAKSMTELLEVFQGEKAKQSGGCQVSSRLLSHSHRGAVQSLVEIKEGLQENSQPMKETSLTHAARKGKRFLPTRKTVLSSLGDRIYEKEDHSESMDSDTLSENEDADFLLKATDEDKAKLATSENKGQAVADRLLEALDAAIENNGVTIFKPFKGSTGYHGRLQQVMQTEKELHIHFLKQLQAENSGADLGRCIDVRILSRYLDAKLTVCECSVIKVTEKRQYMWNSKKLMDNGRSMTIIFNSRTCGDVALEIGKAIRVHHPWKEVELKESGESIILCTYFSQIFVESPVSL